MKIEIGAGTKGLAGYLHVDAVPLGGVDVVDDGRTLQKFEAGVADEIYAHWFLEHVARHEVPPMLSQWRRVLRPGGKLRLVTNNHEAHNQCLARGEITFEEWSYLIYAVENKRGYNVWDIHKAAWNQELLARTLEESGFDRVTVDAQWQCRETDGRLKCPALVAEAYKPGDDRAA
jgi:predicted SAM-dependent methyltransferase